MRFGVKRKQVLGLVSMMFLVLGQSSHAQYLITITPDEALRPVPIAITGFIGAQPMGEQIGDVISADLGRSGLFRPLSREAFIQSAEAAHESPAFSEWQVSGADLLVTGIVGESSGGSSSVEFRLWDVARGVELKALRLTVDNNDWRQGAHIIADQIFEAVTGEPGYFDTSIVYVSESGPADARVKRLAVMDQDGANHRYLTDGSQLVLTPRFSANQQVIAYVAFTPEFTTKLYLYDIASGQQQLLGQFSGMSFAPRFSADGQQLVFSLAEGGNTDIYVMNLSGGGVRRLTNSPGIDTSASFSPDGQQIVFESDRGGSQQLYVMGANGGGATRISFGEGRYGSPAWSPRGDFIAFTKMLGGRFYIGIMRPDGSGERLLADAFHMEGPNWAPNGRALVYFSETPSATGAVARLLGVDITGQANWSIPTPLNGSDPAWGPNRSNLQLN